MQLTQRVEKIHNIIKSSVGKTTPLKDLFNVIEQRISDERSTAEYFHHKEAIKASCTQSDFAAGVFADIDEVNRRFLAYFGLFQMRREIAQSLFYCSCDHVKQSDNMENQPQEPSNSGAVSLYLFSIIKQLYLNTYAFNSS